MPKPLQRKPSASSTENQTSVASQQTDITQNKQVERIGHAGNTEFIRLSLNEMKPVRVLVQALDNQWMPRALAPEAFNAGQITLSIERRLKKAARAEYLRALINSHQAVINRAYIYNNPIVTLDYEKKGPQREAFKDLLGAGVIVPYLMGEVDPVGNPSSVGAASNYQPSKTFLRWQQLCTEVRPQCVRLSWDDKENWDLARQRLSVPFNLFAAGASNGNFDQYISDLRLDTRAKEALGKRLIELGRYTLDIKEGNAERLATRAELYEAFVTSGNPTERKFDQSKPFANEIKQLLDLAYNSNLPDALNGYLITPVDSLPRTALQELRPEQQQKALSGDELLGYLRRTAFALLNQGLNIKSMDRLTLQDIREIRRMDEWLAYIKSLEHLLSNPFTFADGGVGEVYHNYGLLATRITSLVANQGNRQSALVSWLPTVELAFYIGGAALSCIWTPAGPVYQLLGQIGGQVGGAAARVVGRLIIRDRAEKKAQQDLSTSLDFLRATMPDAVKQWKEVERQVSLLPGYQEIRKDLNTAEIVDPVINYRNIDY